LIFEGSILEKTRKGAKYQAKEREAKKPVKVEATSKSSGSHCTRRQVT